jgi:hypothetical protein
MEWIRKYSTEFAVPKVGTEQEDRDALSSAQVKFYLLFLKI